MVFNILYRRPSYVGSFSTASSAKDMKDITPTSSRASTPTSTKISGIPDSLSFDKIIAGGTCPPMTCRDFMNYLIYIEHAAENLQFYLWFLDYSARFKALPENEKVLSQEIVPFGHALADVSRGKNTNLDRSNRPSRISTHFFANTFNVPNARLSVPAQTKSNPFITPPQTPGSPGSSKMSSFKTENLPAGAVAPFLDSGADSTILSDVNHAEVAADAFEAVDMKWQPFTIQPFREEITRIIAIYIAEGSPRELNVSARDRVITLRALATTTHPSALEPLRKAVEDSLRHQAHPNFIRWSIRNGNGPRVTFARGLGVGTILIGFVIAILLTLSERGRSWRAVAAVAWFVGISTLIAAAKGMCVVLHGLHHRHIRPWELWSDHEMNVESKVSFDNDTSNSYEDEPWVAKYASRNIIRKVFDREVWVEEPALRQIQDTIFVQSVLVAIFSSALLAGIFVALPSGGYL